VFADYSSLHTRGKNIQLVETSLQGRLSEVADWCGSNSMIIHPAKTKSMVIATRQKHQLSPLQLKLTLEKTDIEQVHEHRVLGVTIDAEMKWQSQLSNVCKIVSKKLFLLSQLRYYVNVKARKLFYSAHILSHINYASTLWDGCSEVHLKKLNSLHRRAAKLILSDPSIPTDDKLKTLKLLPLTKQLKYNKAVMMFKVRNGKTPEYIRSLFTRSSSRYGSNNFIPP
ncbi:hypothetical protein, partial [Thiolapillus sp.]|uniref:hypothetical protein n=1 Tax=Thiolapillus sp. TaxID=2017437 RepID=UPI0025D7F17D